MCTGVAGRYFIEVLLIKEAFPRDVINQIRITWKEPLMLVLLKNHIVTLYFNIIWMWAYFVVAVFNPLFICLFISSFYSSSSVQH